MSDTTERLARVEGWDQTRALVLIGEAVWWVTIVDATLVPREFLMVDEKLIRATVKAKKGKVEIPGVRVFKKASVAAKGVSATPVTPTPAPAIRPSSPRRRTVQTPAVAKSPARRSSFV